jgi:hypothetical protein
MPTGVICRTRRREGPPKQPIEAIVHNYIPVKVVRVSGRFSSDCLRLVEEAKGSILELTMIDNIQRRARVAAAARSARVDYLRCCGA